METHFSNTKNDRCPQWKSLDRAYVNFCHWGVTQGGPDSHEFTERGFFVNWLRHKANFLKHVNFPRIDFVIPMAVLPKERVGDQILQPSDMSFIVISVKNKHYSGEVVSMPYIPREYVEGDRKPCTEKSEKIFPAKRRKRKADESTTPSKWESDIPMVSKHNFHLDLNSLPFVKAVNNNSTHGPFPQTNKDKPFIAFTMSLGDTDRQKDLFIGDDRKAKLALANFGAPKTKVDPAIVIFLYPRFR